jgi:murein DD-endopeptidase MepM/ murein hydrolase activator NlpD
MRLFLTTLLALGLAFLPRSAADADDDPVGVWPLQPQPEVVAAFDPPTSPYGPGHRGVDLLGHLGQQVRAALGGTITYAGPLFGRGVVVVSHGDTRTTYEPVAATVTVGERVPEGGVIGTLEAVASHCAPRTCLHWGWLRGDIYLDPLLLVGAGAVRLLPLWRDLPVRAVPLALPYAGWRAPGTSTAGRSTGRSP